MSAESCCAVPCTVKATWAESMQRSWQYSYSSGDIVRTKSVIVADVRLGLSLLAVEILLDSACTICHWHPLLGVTNQ